MPSINPAVLQWIRQMDDDDAVIAYYAYQCLLEEVMHASAPGREEEQKVLATALGEALVAEAKEDGPARGRQATSFSGNPFLAAAASQFVAYAHPPRTRANLARLLGYIPDETAVPYLHRALQDLDAREMARCSLECHPAESATSALIAALGQPGADFCSGVVNSLAKKKGGQVAAALRAAAKDPQLEVRLAALDGLANVPDPSHDTALEEATRSSNAEESRKAHIARIRLAGTLRASGNRQAAERIYQSVLTSTAGEPQKRAARLALGMASTP